MAFGIPGVLMLIATVVFWAGRGKYMRVPPTPREIRTRSSRGSDALPLLAPGSRAHGAMAGFGAWRRSVQCWAARAAHAWLACAFRTS